MASPRVRKLRRAARAAARLSVVEAPAKKEPVAAKQKAPVKAKKTSAKKAD